MSERRPSSSRSSGSSRSGSSRSGSSRSGASRSGAGRSSGGRSGDSSGDRRSSGRGGPSRGGGRDGGSLSGGRSGVPRQRRDDDRPSRGPRRDDDRPFRGRRDDDRPSRGPRRDDDRPFRGRRDDDRPSRGPRRDDDRPRTRSYRDDDRPSRGPRRDDDRPFRGRRDDERPSRGPRRDDDRPSRGPRRDDDRPFRGRRDDDRPAFRRDRSPRGDRFEREEEPRTAAERRRAEVRRRTGGRVTTGEMSRAPERSRVEWQDEGPIGRRSSREPGRSTAPKRSSRSRKELRALDSVVEEFEKKIRGKAAARAIRRYEEALIPFEAQRYDEARRLLLPMSKEYADVAAVHEMLGLCLYRAGRWSAAVRELERALELNPSWVFNHAVLADCHRALKNWSRVAQLWEELSAASPSAELVAEGRIVMAGSLADQGLLDDALRTMKKADADQANPKEHHLRQWFVIADLHDRLGNVIEARRFFERVARHDPQFVDVAERLSTLGA